MLGARQGPMSCLCEGGLSHMTDIHQKQCYVPTPWRSCLHLQKVQGLALLAEGDVVDTLGMPLEGGQHFVCSTVIKLDDLVIATCEELAWTKPREHD